MRIRGRWPWPRLKPGQFVYVLPVTTARQGYPGLHKEGATYNNGFRIKQVSIGVSFKNKSGDNG